MRCAIRETRFRQVAPSAIHPLLRTLHASLPAQLSCLLASAQGEEDARVLDLVYDEEHPSIGLGPILESPLIGRAAAARRSLCSGHFAPPTGAKSALPDAAFSVLLCPFSSPGEGDLALLFSHPGTDIYRDRDVDFVRSVLRRESVLRDHLGQSAALPSSVSGSAGGLSVLSLTPYYVHNMLSTFLRAAGRALHIDALVLTAWSEIVPKGELLQVVGWRNGENSPAKPSDRAEALIKRMGSSFRLGEFTIFYKKFRRRAEMEEIIPRLPVSVTAPLQLHGRSVGSITLKTRVPEGKEALRRRLPDLTPLIVWEMQIARRRGDLGRRMRGDEQSIVSAMSFQDELTTSFNSAKRFGEALSAIVFSPLKPQCLPEPTRQSLSRLFLLMRKSVRAVDTASLMEPHGFTVLLPKATQKEAARVAERLMKLADEVLKHERYLGRNVFLKYKVVSFPEIAKDEVELWEAIAASAPL